MKHKIIKIGTSQKGKNVVMRLIPGGGKSMQIEVKYNNQTGPRNTCYFLPNERGRALAENIYENYLKDVDNIGIPFKRISDRHKKCLQKRN